MKKLFTILFLSVAFVSSAQIKFSDLALYNGNMSGAYSVGYVGNANRRFDMNSWLLKSDTAAMLQNYRHWLVGYATVAQLNGRLATADTAAMLLNYRHWLAGYALQANVYTKAQGDARYLQSFTETDPKRTASLSFSGTNTKTLTLTLADNSTVSGSFADLQGGSGGSQTDTLPLSQRITANVNSITALQTGKEPTIAPGTTGQYWRGDKTWVAFPTIPAAVDTTPLSTRLTTNVTAVNNLQANKVDKVTGKGLSTNDYTDAEKTKLAGVATGATANSTDAQLRDRSTHTGTQAATTITEDATHRFATDAEKTTWNGKQISLNYFYPETYGALGNAKSGKGGMTSGSTTLTATASLFVSGDVGKAIKVRKAGASGGDLITTIASYTSATTVTLSTAASATVSAQRIVFGTDDGQAFQDCINAVQTAGGGTIYLSAKGYVIARDFQNTSNANSQLVLPLLQLSDPALSISILGPQRPPNQFHPGESGGVPEIGFARLISIISGGSGDASMIGVQTYTPTSLNQRASNVVPSAENVIIEMPSNAYHAGLNFQYAQAPGPYKNLLFHAGTVETFDIVEPTNSTNVSLKLPEYNHSPYISVEGFTTVGIHSGLQLGELTSGKGVRVYSAKRGLVAPFAYHPSNFTDVGVYETTYPIYVTGANFLSIQNFDLQHANNTAQAWQNTLYDIYDPSNLLQGVIAWKAISAGVGDDHTFTKNGGANSFLTTYEMGAVPFKLTTTGTGAASLTGGTLNVPTASAGGGYQGFSAGVLFDNGSSPSISHNSPTTLNLQEQWDDLNAYSSSNGVFTAPSAGKYRFSANPYWTNGVVAGDVFDITIYKNNTPTFTVSRLQAATTSDISAGGGIILQLSANDQVKFVATATLAAGSGSRTCYVYLQGEKL